MRYKAYNWQEKRSITGTWADMDGLDNRLWRIKAIDDAPKSHRIETAKTYKVLEILPENMVGAVRIQGLGYRPHDFENFVLVNSDLTPLKTIPETIGNLEKTL